MTTQGRKFFLAIRHKPSGGFLPQMASYGFTRCEPTVLEPPRLFTKIGGAKQALSRWLEGEWFEGHYDDETGKQEIRVIAKAHRQASLMEIVEIEIVFRSLSDAQLRIL